MCDSVRPQRRKPTRLPHPWDSPGKNTGVGCHFLLQCMKVKSESEVAQSCLTLSETPWTAAYQAPPSMGYSRQEYWSGVPLPSPIGKQVSLDLFLFYSCMFKKLFPPPHPTPSLWLGNLWCPRLDFRGASLQLLHVII